MIHRALLIVLLGVLLPSGSGEHAGADQLTAVDLELGRIGTMVH